MATSKPKPDPRLTALPTKAGRTVLWQGAGRTKIRLIRGASLIFGSDPSQEQRLTVQLGAAFQVGALTTQEVLFTTEDRIHEGTIFLELRLDMRKEVWILQGTKESPVRVPWEIIETEDPGPPTPRNFVFALPGLKYLQITIK